MDRQYDRITPLGAISHSTGVMMLLARNTIDTISLVELAKGFW
jgi:hypothetical protein